MTTNTNYPMNQSELEANTCNRRQARENACERVTIVTSDWSRTWPETFDPITEQNKGKPNQTQTTFNTQLKTVSHTRLLLSFLDTQIIAIQTHSKPTPMAHPVHVEDGGRTDIAHLSYTLNSALVGHRYCREKTKKSDCVTTSCLGFIIQKLVDINICPCVT